MEIQFLIKKINSFRESQDENENMNQKILEELSDE